MPASGEPSVGRDAARRLDSWKLVADYLGRSCRTVQRWHVLYGLPIHRLGGDRGAVFAFADELDAWMRNRGQDEDSAPAAVPKRPAPKAESDTDKLIPFVLRASGAETAVACRRQSAELTARATAMWRNLSWGNLRIITRTYREAIDLDVGNAEAFAGLAACLIAQGVFGAVRTAPAYRGAAVAVENALALDPELPLARAAGAMLDILYRRRWHQAAESLDAILAANPSFTHALVGRSALRVAAGDLSGAAADFSHISEVNALNISAASYRAWCLYLEGHYRQCIFELRQSHAAARPSPFSEGLEALALLCLGGSDSQLDRLERLAAVAHDRDVLDGALGYFHAMAGRTARAREILDYLAQNGDEDTAHEPYAIALVLLGLGETKGAVRRLMQAFHEGSIWGLGFRFDPMLGPLRKNPTFQAFLAGSCCPDSVLRP